MSHRVTRDDLVQSVSEKTGKDIGSVNQIVDATLEEIYAALKRGECVSLKNLGTFYVRPGRESWVFKFNPSQRLRALFGWSSAYKGDL